MSTFDNGPALPDWQMPPRCCGTWADGLVCSICANYVPRIPANVELGSE